MGEIEEVFDLLDVQKRGKLNAREALVALRALDVPLAPSEPYIAALASQRADHAIARRDFILFAREALAAVPPAVLRQKTFALFDGEGKGFVTFADLKRKAQELNQDISDDELAAMIAEADDDQDGRVTFEDFERIISKTHLTAILSHSNLSRRDRLM